MLWIPVGFAHGFSVISAKASVLYEATDFYAPEYERTLARNDPELTVRRLEGDPIVSAKDQRGRALRNVETFEQPQPIMSIGLQYCMINLPAAVMRSRRRIRTPEMVIRVVAALADQRDELLGVSSA
jgi:hypothetical protein